MYAPDTLAPPWQMQQPVFIPMMADLRSRYMWPHQSLRSSWPGKLTRLCPQTGPGVFVLLRVSFLPERSGVEESAVLSVLPASVERTLLCDIPQMEMFHKNKTRADGEFDDTP
jgi:hypothetical protein